MAKHKVKAHHRSAPVRRPKAAPAPGQHEFSPDEEMAMRQGQRAANMAPPTTGPAADAEMAGMEQDSGIPGAL